MQQNRRKYTVQKSRSSTVKRGSTTKDMSSASVLRKSSKMVQTLVSFSKQKRLSNKRKQQKYKISTKKQDNHSMIAAIGVPTLIAAFSINSRTVSLLIDTGSTVSILPRQLATNLRPTKIQLTTANGQ